MNWGNINEMECLVIYTFLLQHLLLFCPSTPHRTPILLVLNRQITLGAILDNFLQKNDSINVLCMQELVSINSLSKLGYFKSVWSNININNCIFWPFHLLQANYLKSYFEKEAQVEFRPICYMGITALR